MCGFILMYSKVFKASLSPLKKAPGVVTVRSFMLSLIKLL